MAGAARVTIAEVDEIVELGELDPEAIVTPGVYVDRVVARPKEAPVQEGEITDTQAEESKKRFEAKIKGAKKRKGSRK
jgi:3-oxoadipate CoA-transferase alpha subunit